MPEKVYVANRSFVGTNGRAYNVGEKVVIENPEELNSLLANGCLVLKELQKAALSGTGDHGGVGGGGSSDP